MPQSTEMLTHSWLKSSASHHIIVMDQGVTAQRGAPHELYESPPSEFVAGFMGEAMLFDGGVCTEQQKVSLGTLSITAPVGVQYGPVKVAVRPEAWTIIPVANDGLAARVLKTTYVGSTVEYTFSSQFGEIFVVPPEVKQTPAQGAPVSLHLADHGVSIVAAVNWQIPAFGSAELGTRKLSVNKNPSAEKRKFNRPTRP
jgi:iron(III) transport system ATP-binding protein